MQREADDDALPFVSRPKQKMKVMKVQPEDAKATATTVAGATSTYNEMLDDDNEVEADDPGPESTLEGKSLCQLKANCRKGHRVYMGADCRTTCALQCI